MQEDSVLHTYHLKNMSESFKNKRWTTGSPQHNNDEELRYIIEIQQTQLVFGELNRFGMGAVGGYSFHEAMGMKGLKDFISSHFPRETEAQVLIEVCKMLFFRKEGLASSELSIQWSEYAESMKGFLFSPKKEIFAAGLRVFLFQLLYDVPDHLFMRLLQSTPLLHEYVLMGDQKVNDIVAFKYAAGPRRLYNFIDSLSTKQIVPSLNNLHSMSPKKISAKLNLWRKLP